MNFTSASTSLCPGYKQVDAFGPDEHYDDEEVTYVTLDLGSIEPTLVPSSTTYRLIGLDTPTPFLQLSGTILKGQHDSLLGTELLFTDGKDPQDKTKRLVTHVSNTEQRICFKEVRLQPKSNGKEGEEESFVEKEDSQMLDPQMVDRVTGKIAPRARAPRTRGDSPKKKGKRKGKARATTPDNNVEGGSGVGVPMDIYEG